MKCPDWVERLWAVIEAAAEVPFNYGAHDCGTFAARCVDAMTDGTLEAELEGLWTDDASALGYVVSHGGLDVILSARFGEAVAPLQARRGDLVMLPGEDATGRALGVCVGDTVACLQQSGIVYAPLSSALCAWRVD